MKKNVFIMGLAATAAFICSCTKQNTNSIIQSKMFEIVSISQTIEGKDVFDTCVENLQNNYELEFTLPVEKTLRKGIEKTIIEKVLYNDSITDFQEALIYDFKTWKNTWINDVKEAQEDGDLCWWGNYECEIGGAVSMQHQGMVEFTTHNYFYLGGAHGMHNSQIFHFDEKTGKELLIDDIFCGNYTAVLNSLVREAAADADGVDDPYSVEIHDNFFITTYGIQMHYDAYEIGCYAAGDFDLPIDYQNFKGVVKPEWRKIWE